MNANTAVVARMGVMVRSARSIYVYWRGVEQGLTIRITDLSGHPVAQLLDGSGVRRIVPGAGESAVYIEDLLPGYIYHVELGQESGAGFVPLLSAATVQTPWLPGTDDSAFASQYHRS